MSPDANRLEPATGAGVEHDLPAGSPALVRIYRPDHAGNGAFGPGFRSLLDLSLVAVDGHVVVELPDRHRLRFVPTSHGWMCTAGPHHVLAVSDRTWRLGIHTRRRVATAEFDVHGLLTTWTSDAARVRLNRDRRGRTIAVDDGRHRLHLAWTDEKIVQATTDRGHTATYEYGTTGSSAGRLVRVRRPDGVVSYLWNDGTARRRHLAAVG